MLVNRDSIITTLHQSLVACSKFTEAGDYDYNNSGKSITELVNFLNSLSESLIATESENEDSEKLATEILTQIHEFVASPSLKMEVVDALAFELPKAVARFVCISTRCLDVAEGLVDLFVENSNPRDMLSILCEAISTPVEPFIVPGNFLPLLNGLIKVLSLIQRQHYKQVKTAIPVILNGLKVLCSILEERDEDYGKLFHKATAIAYSIRGICMKLEGEDNKKMRALLSLYVLQIMYLVSNGITIEKSESVHVVLKLSGLFEYCELSYRGLITGCEVNTISKLVLGGDENEDVVDCFSQVELGAALAVIWGYKVSEVAMAAKADIHIVMMELQSNWTRRWEAIGTLKYLFSCGNLPWELKHDGIKFVQCVMDGIVTQPFNDLVDYSHFMPNMYTSLQAIEMVIVYASDSSLRKTAFHAFRQVLADIPTSARFDILRALIQNSDSSSMIAILLGCVKEEMHSEKITRKSVVTVLNSDVGQSTSFWNPSVLELVKVVLRPPLGGPPSLPEYSDSVLSALNLYRYILITESAGKCNLTGILLKNKLQEAYNEWLLPLRVLVTGVVSENEKDYDPLASDSILCALNPVELVLYRCIELVEEKLNCL